MSGEKREEYSTSEKEEKEEEDIEEKDHEMLKSRISNHPLYDLLVQQHLNCLKVGEVSNFEKVKKKKERNKKASMKQNLGMLSHSELDHFMEAYCVALGKLKEAMEEPQTESLAFINNMHSQLRDLAGLTLSPSSSSSNLQTHP
ncbi:homeobox protein knotted-1-like 1 [Neltuma alba]|uniref:homeobox protein knotted-1-like 1 n=1 Tax=Neltuma alba TaxID=207710 RepID=UPI0010A56D54|nr:homeobox protein knotted-1-like 1 [Prosopis alba]